MPVTAKLSRNFYERFGDDIATELVDWFNAVDATYQAQLREVNELNWERFKAELHVQGAELRREMAEMHAALRQEMAEMHAGLRQEMTAMEARLRREMADMRAELLGRIGDVRSELLKWMFVYWSGTVLTVGGLMVALATLLRD